MNTHLPSAGCVIDPGLLSKKTVPNDSANDTPRENAAILARTNWSLRINSRKMVKTQNTFEKTEHDYLFPAVVLLK